MTCVHLAPSLLWLTMGIGGPICRPEQALRVTKVLVFPSSGEECISSLQQGYKCMFRDILGPGCLAS